TPSLEAVRCDGELTIKGKRLLDLNHELHRRSLRTTSMASPMPTVPGSTLAWRRRRHLCCDAAHACSSPAKPGIRRLVTEGEGSLGRPWGIAASKRHDAMARGRIMSIQNSDRLLDRDPYVGPLAMLFACSSPRGEWDASADS